MYGGVYWDLNHSALYFPNSSSPTSALLTRFWLDGSGARGAAGPQRARRALSGGGTAWRGGPGPRRALSARAAAAGAQG
jgi:hypothetical protein